MKLEYLKKGMSELFQKPAFIILALLFIVIALYLASRWGNFKMLPAAKDILGGMNP